MQSSFCGEIAAKHRLQQVSELYWIMDQQEIDYSIILS